MRTAIFLAGMFVKDGLDKGVSHYNENTISVLAITLLVMAAFDIVEFCNNLKKK